ncbi:DUF3034 family protein [Aliidiomarina celeris]|uniref:DUF3034 family protein n=1 Tax=Aliidiomarina celeris TaxID=2249428 RepID=UPI001E3721EC|nr:DUF3034 family protein [Aliidiomarina celeris]
MKTRMKILASLLPVVLSCALVAPVSAEGGRLLATGGVTMIEGAAGGGLVPWAVLSSYAEEDEWGGTVAVSQADVNDFRLSVMGVSVNYRNRLELSFAKQTFNLTTIGGDLTQNILGAKYRLGGDILYGQMPQISLGLQYKENTRFGLPQAVGAQRDSDIDAYLAVSRAWLAGPFDRTWLVNGTVRATRANETGLLGFGGDLNDSHELLAEVAVGVFLHRSLALGVEYKQKPSNLGFAEESDWSSLFMAWFPSKSVAITGAYVDLGEIAGLAGQEGFYLSLQASF